MKHYKSSSSILSVLNPDHSKITLSHKPTFSMAKIKHLTPVKRKSTNFKPKFQRPKEFPIEHLEKKLKFQKFFPTSRCYVQLSSSPAPYDLKGKSLENDVDSISKAINYEKAIKKARDLHNQLKAFIIKSAQKSILHKIEMIAKPEDCGAHPKKIEFFKEIRAGNVEKVTELIRETPELVKLQDSTGQTALHWACRRGNMELVRLLLNFGANPSASDIAERTPAHIAQSKGHGEIESFLVGIRRVSRHNTQKTLPPAK